MTREEILREVAKIGWWHRIKLGDGIITPGIDRSGEKLRNTKLPENLSGKTVLDIGAWDGFFSFEAEKRGALRVLATDSFCWGGEGWGTKDGFNLARKVLDSKVEEMEIDPMDLSVERIGKFDLVLFLGVLYHLRDPIKVLKNVYEVTKGQLILETHVDLLNVKGPAVAYYPNDELNSDKTNWWGPNPAGLFELLKYVGFKRIKIVTPPHGFLYRLVKAFYMQIFRNKPFFKTINIDRISVHAWK